MLNSSLLTLDPLSENDIDLFVNIYSDPITMKYIGPVLSVDAANKLFKKVTVTGDNHHFFVVRSSANNTPYGVIGLISNKQLKSTYELGVMISSQYNSKGYAYKATDLLLKYAFTDLKLQVVCVYCHQENLGANRIAKALGFLDKGMREEKQSANNKNHWEMTFEQFKKTTER